jgi:hypothetical protein
MSQQAFLGVGDANVRNTGSCCGFFLTGFPSSDIRQYSRRSARNFANNYEGGGVERLCTSLVKVFFSVATMFGFFILVSHSVFDDCYVCGAVSLAVVSQTAGCDS